MLSGNGELDSRRIPEISASAERSGFTGLWFGETTLRDASILTTIAASATRKIQLGTAILNVYTRTPSQLALLGNTLNEFSGGRFTLGLGVSTAAIVESWHGIRFDNPISRVDETVRIIRQYFSGERFSAQGKYSSPTSAKLRSVLPSPKIALAALNDGMIREAALVSDRIILNLYPTERIRHAATVVEEACNRAGKKRPILSVMLYSQMPDDGKGLDSAKELISFYASAPAYSSLFSSLGFHKEANAMLEAWRKKDRDLVKRNVTEQMIEKMMVLGSVQDLGERVRMYHEVGVDDVLCSPSPFGNYEENLNEIITTFKP
jgi:probable F420-dependent oxidoreductase